MVGFRTCRRPSESVPILNHRAGDNNNIHIRVKICARKACLQIFIRSPSFPARPPDNFACIAAAALPSPQPHNSTPPAHRPTGPRGSCHRITNNLVCPRRERRRHRPGGTRRSGHSSRYPVCNCSSNIRGFYEEERQPRFQQTQRHAILYLLHVLFYIPHPVFRIRDPWGGASSLI